MNHKKAYVVGNNVSKSLSPLIFNYWFSKYSINAEYGFIEIKKEDFSTTIEKILTENNLCGLNITTPFKQNIIKHLNQIDNESKTIGAVNCVTIKNNCFFGSNTDWIGYAETLKENTNKEERVNKEVIIIGYGGAAKAILHALLKFEFKKIHVFNRSLEKMKDLTNNKIEIHNLFEIKNFVDSSSLIINTIPKDVLIDLDIPKKLHAKTTISDIIYNPPETNFLCHFLNPYKKIYGITMLIYQAIPCFEKWFGIKPAVDKGLLEITKKEIVK